MNNIIVFSRYGESRSHRDRYRYETDGSHYDKDDSRYERNRRRGDRDRERDNYGRYRDDRHLKPSDYDRETRDDRGIHLIEFGTNHELFVKHRFYYLLIHVDRYRGRDDRYSDYEKPRRDRKKDRSANVSERGDYPAGYYHAASMAQPFGYDPITSYLHNQQYYENLRRTNPIAYAEWYNRYFANQMGAALTVAASDRGRESGRESVHSGRSSSKDNDR